MEQHAGVWLSIRVEQRSVTPAASTLIDGGLAQQVAGLAAYAFWQRSVYAEFGFYRTADGALSVFRTGQDINTPEGWRA